MFTVQFNDKKETFEGPVRLADLIEDTNKSFIAAEVNHRLRELSYQFQYDADVSFLTLSHPEAVKVYETSLRYLLAMAFDNIFPDYKIKLKYSISRSIFCYIKNQENINIDEILPKIDAEMKRLVKEDLPFVRVTFTKEQAIEFYKKQGDYDRVQVLKYRPEETVHMYSCDGYMNYMYGYMVQSTGYLTDYNLIPYDIGFLIQYPRAEENQEIPEFKDAPKYIETLRNASIWADVVNASLIADFNAHLENKSIIEFVHMCETKHNAMLVELGDMIKNRDEIRLIAIAGPSSSGKTTFSNRLRIELMTRGLEPITISLDDYYLNRDDIPELEDGTVDLEHINTLDIDLFHRNMKDLIDGKEAMIPQFDFHSKKRSGLKPLRVTKQNPIIIEGIHALNEKLTAFLPNEQTFHIFISPQLQINLDNQNPISITNLRLIRRIVRDKQFRNSSALRTISMWDSVRRGEFRWIYPNQERADYVFNSGLQYELSVLKKYALPTLQEIPNDSPYYITANRLIKFMKYFIDIDDTYVPNNSLLREFIGGSCFTNME